MHKIPHKYVEVDNEYYVIDEDFRYDFSAYSETIYFYVPGKGTQYKNFVMHETIIYDEKEVYPERFL